MALLTSRTIAIPQSYSRRSFVHGAFALGAYAGGLLISGCARPKPSVAGSSVAPALDLPESACHLAPVRVSADREIRTMVGLRPFRRSGFRVEMQQVGAKRVVHNYGHGGCGLTLSWGTAKLAADMGLQGHTGPVAVLGCGAVGLAAARVLQDSGCKVTIYAKNLPPETTSNIAGGEWGPSYVGDPQSLTASFNQQMGVAQQIAYRRFQIMVGERYGVRWIKKYLITSQPMPDAMVRCPEPCTMPGMRKLADNENPFRIGFAAQIDEMLIEPEIYLTAVMDDVRRAGGSIEVREFKAIEELQSVPEGLIFNCTGLGAKALFNDEQMNPLRGQLTILLPQPEVNYATGYDDAYMFPRRDGILLGGTHELGNWSTEPDLIKKAEILTKQKALFSQMRTC